MVDPVPSYVPKLVPSGQTTATTYHFRCEPRGYGWALATVNDQTGELLIMSDWGNWSHRWSADPAHLGKPTLTHFIADRDACHYLADKLTTRKDRDVFDPVETVKHMQRVICKQRLEQGRAVIDWFRDEDPEDRIDVGGDWTERCHVAETRKVWVFGRYEQWPLSKSTARSIFDELEELSHQTSVDLFVADFNGLEGHEWISTEPWHDDLRHRPDTSYMVLLHGILPALVEACREQVNDRAQRERMEAGHA